MKYLLILTALTFSQSLSAQKGNLHTPAEMIKIAVDSKISYNLSILEKPVDIENYEDNLLGPDYYRVEEKDRIIVKRYDIKGKAKVFFDTAETQFQNNKLTQARDNYLKAYNEDKTLAIALTYAGQVCEHAGNYTEAETLLKKSIDQNYGDYMAHWFLANVYEHNGAIKKAQEEILIAHILNRNNPRIIVALKEILLKDGFKYNNVWQFNPQFMVQKTDSGITVQYDGIWLGYAIAKALWHYEPGYKESMGVSKDEDITFNQDAEKEGLLSILISAQNNKEKQLPESVKALQSATDAKMFQEYLFYEIWLRKRPDLALQLPIKFIKEISEYVLKVRCSRT